MPTDEPLEECTPLPPIDTEFTVVAADGTPINSDSHGASFYRIINICSMVYRHSSGMKPEVYTKPILGYCESDICEDGTLVAGNLLGLRRDIAEITQLADLCAAESKRTLI